jgi:RIO-like serine/threonine protein kinase
MKQEEFHVPRFLPRWVKSSLSQQQNILATSNQGTILHFNESGVEFLVKTAMGTGAVRRARETTLQREYQAYLRMQGLEGVPRCYGMVDNRYLVLEYVHGSHYREAEFDDREAWFASLLRIIRSIHERGVAHGDLKSKSNLLVTREQRPCVIDFGTTVLYKPGLHPFNNTLFEYLKRLDINAWVKHKYHGRYEDASPEDARLLDYSRFESLLRRYRKWKKRNG